MVHQEVLWEVLEEAHLGDLLEAQWVQQCQGPGVWRDLVQAACPGPAVSPEEALAGCVQYSGKP